MRYCLFHELTHAVQDMHPGFAFDWREYVCYELHADVIAGYCLVNCFDRERLDRVLDTAFTFPASGSHPPGCLRRGAIIGAVSVGAAVMSIDQNLFREISSREEFFTDSWEYVNNHRDGPRPCDLTPSRIDTLCIGCLERPENLYEIVGLSPTKARKLGSILDREDGTDAFLKIATGLNTSKYKIFVLPNEGKHLGRPHVHVTVAGEHKRLSFDARTGELMEGDVRQKDAREIGEIILENTKALVKQYKEIQSRQIGSKKLPRGRRKR